MTIDKKTLKDKLQRELAADAAVAAQTPDTVLPLDHRRGIRACVLDGWRIFALSPGRFLLQLLPYALLAAAGVAWFVTAAVELCARTVVPARLYLSDADDNAAVWEVFAPQTADWLALLVAFAVAVLSCFLAKGALWEQIRTFSKTATLPRKFLLLPTLPLLKTTGRVLLWNVLFFLITLLPVALIVGVAWLTDFYYLCLLIAPVAIVLTAMGVPGRVAWMLGESPLMGALRTVWREGVRHCGGYIIVTILTAIPLLTVCMALTLPYFSLPFAIFADAETVELGAVSGLPAYFPYVHFGVAAVSLLFALFVSTFQTWSLVFKAGTGKD